MSTELAQLILPWIKNTKYVIEHNSGLGTQSLELDSLRALVSEIERACEACVTFEKERTERGKV